MYRHLTPATARGYAREVNLLADFAAALAGLDKSDIMGMVEFDEDNTHVSTVHAVLWLHLERKSRLAYGTVFLLAKLLFFLCIQRKYFRNH
jgi:hypothetical protein